MNLYSSLISECEEWRNLLFIWSSDTIVHVSLTLLLVTSCFLYHRSMLMVRRGSIILTARWQERTYPLQESYFYQHLMYTYKWFLIHFIQNSPRRVFRLVKSDVSSLFGLELYSLYVLNSFALIFPQPWYMKLNYNSKLTYKHIQKVDNIVQVNFNQYVHIVHIQQICLLKEVRQSHYWQCIHYDCVPHLSQWQDNSLSVWEYIYSCKPV